MAQRLFVLAYELILLVNSETISAVRCEPALDLSHLQPTTGLSELQSVCWLKYNSNPTYPSFVLGEKLMSQFICQKMLGVKHRCGDGPA